MSWPKMSLICNTVLYIVMQIGVLPTCRIWKISHGFNTNSVEEYEFSTATFAHYVHYRITLPNADVQFKVSGNYVLVVYPENEPENILLQVCFSVYENQVLVAPSVTSRTDIDYNRERQRVEVALNTNNYRVQKP